MYASHISLTYKDLSICEVRESYISLTYKGVELCQVYASYIDMIYIDMLMKHIFYNKIQPHSLNNLIAMVIWDL
jgi:hypothetical protein